MNLEQQELNLGSVIYRMTDEGLDAEWMQIQGHNRKKGTGKAIKLTKAGAGQSFEGEYEIIYQDDLGNHSPKFRLSIAKCKEGYDLIWRNEQEITDQGIGFVSEGRLIAGFQSF